MRFKVNLASTPYENARRFFTQWGIALAALFLVSALLVYAAARSWRANHALSRGIAEERGRLDKLDTAEKADLAILNQDRNADVRERSAALNALIARKSFSWTRIFNDLEKMMPTRLHVVSISPQLTPGDEINIRMMVAGDSRDKAIELVQNMEKAPDFRDPQIVSENTVARAPGQPNSDTVTFEIVAQYLPAAAAAMGQAEKNTAADSQSRSPAASAKTGTAENRNSAVAPKGAPKPAPRRMTGSPAPKGGSR